MPSMLGLTKDPSPHGLNATASATDQGQWQTEDSNFGRELALQTAGSINGGLSGGREVKVRDEKSKSGWKAPDRRMARKSNPNKPHLPESKDAGNEEGRKNNIKGRNEAAAVEMETLVWRALCDKPKTAMKYMAKDAVVSNWLVFGDTEPKDKDSEPSLKEALEDCEPYMSYRMRNSQVVEIGLMAVAIVYEVTLFRQAGEPEEDGTVRFETDEATVSTVWRQCASSDWELASMTVG